jgi:hypothetical protein
MAALPIKASLEITQITLVREGPNKPWDGHIVEYYAAV